MCRIENSVVFCEIFVFRTMIIEYFLSNVCQFNNFLKTIFFRYLFCQLNFVELFLVEYFYTKYFQGHYYLLGFIFGLINFGELITIQSLRIFFVEYVLAHQLFCELFFVDYQFARIVLSNSFLFNQFLVEYSLVEFFCQISNICLSIILEMLSSNIFCHQIFLVEYVLSNIFCQIFVQKIDNRFLLKYFLVE